MSQVRHLPALLIAAVLAFSPAVLGQDVDEEYPEEDVGPVFNPWRPDRWDAVVDEVPLPGPKPPQPSSSTVSVSTLKVPKKAGKAYDRALADIRKNRLESAERNMAEAVRIYPEFGLAWAGLGAVQFARNRLDEADTALRKAVALEPKYPYSYELLCEMARLRQSWRELAAISAGALDALGHGQPQYHLNIAVANFALGRYSEAGKEANETVRLDPELSWPQARLVLGLVQYLHDDLDSAVRNIRVYLEAVPEALDAAVVRQQLAQIEELRATAVKH